MQKGEDEGKNKKESKKRKKEKERERERIKGKSDIPQHQFSKRKPRLRGPFSFESNCPRAERR